MSVSPDEIFLQFSSRLEQLKDWPDRDLILSMTKICEDFVSLGQFFVEIVVNKLIHVHTNSSYKRPIFYLIDSIMKNVGGPFPAMFTKAFAEIHQPALMDIPDVDRVKVDFLLGTWIERQLLPVDLLESMRQYLATAPRSAPRIPPVQEQNFPPMSQPDATTPFHNIHRNQPNMPFDVNYAQLVTQEMNNILHQLYMDRKLPRPLTIDECAQYNPQGYLDIQHQAELNVQLILNGPVHVPAVPVAPMLSVPPTLTVPGQQPMTRGAGHQGGRKRPFDAAGHGPPHGNHVGYPNRFQRQDRGGRQQQAPRQGQHQYNNGHSLPPHVPPISQPPPTLHTPQEGHFVNGYIAENVVAIDLDRTTGVKEKLRKHEVANTLAMPNYIMGKLIDKLDFFLTHLNTPSALPPILFGPLPLEPLFATVTKVTTSLTSTNEKKIPKPMFNVAALNKRPDGMIRALYLDRPHQFHEDGLRFKTLQQLQEHTNKFLERKILYSKKKQQKEVREYRELFCKISQWISDFNALNKRKGSISDGADTGSSSAATVSSAGKDNTVNEEFIVPADENFPRCPMSKERFETFWDNDEGELMYRHAVKVLVTEAADADIYKVAADILGTKDGVKYLIVHKLLVLDKWLMEGRAVTLKDAVLRYENMEGKGQDYILKIRDAAGQEQDDEDIFVLLELSI